MVPTKKVIPKVKEVPTTPIKQEKITRAVQPTFSEELLKAVQNWKKIPKSVFPLKNVSINEDVSLKLLNSAGEVIAESKMESGREVVVKSINGQSLLVSPTLASNLKGEINLDKTDFKQSVAFRFEMGKKIIEMRKRLKEQKEKGTTGVNSVEANKKMTIPFKHQTCLLLVILDMANFVYAQSAEKKIGINRINEIIT